VDLSVGGAAIVVDAQSDPKLDAGEDVYLYIDSPYLDEPIVTLGRVQRCSKKDGEAHYGLRIVDWLGLLTQLPSELKALFNQRSEYRVGVGPNHPIEVEGISRNFCVNGLLHDLTPHGLCFQVPMDAEGTFRLGHVVRVTFALPDEEEQLTFAARIRHAQWTGGRLYCGVCFEKDDAEDELPGDSEDIFADDPQDASKDASKDDSKDVRVPEAEGRRLREGGRAKGARGLGPVARAVS